MLDLELKSRVSKHLLYIVSALWARQSLPQLLTSATVARRTPWGIHKLYRNEGCIPTKLYLQKGGRPDLACGPLFANPWPK